MKYDTINNFIKPKPRRTQTFWIKVKNHNITEIYNALTTKEYKVRFDNDDFYKKFTEYILVINDSAHAYSSTLFDISSCKNAPFKKLEDL